jgi:hypothetical protein
VEAEVEAEERERERESPLTVFPVLAKPPGALSMNISLF